MHQIIDREEETNKYYQCKYKKPDAMVWPSYPQFQTYIESSRSVFIENGQWAFIRNSCYNPSENSFILIDGSKDDVERLSSIFSTLTILLSSSSVEQCYQNHSVAIQSSSTLLPESLSIYNRSIPWYFPLTSNQLHSTASLYSLLRHPEQYPKVLLFFQLVSYADLVDFHSSFPGAKLSHAKNAAFIHSI